MSDIHKTMSNIIENISRVIIGKSGAAELMLTALMCEGHVLVEDVPGVGKTSLVSAMAKSVDCSFRRIQFTPDILPSDITGFSIFNQKTGEFEYRQGLVMSSFILADEINRTSPKTQASLLEAMEENQVTVDGVSRPVSRPFMVMATQNPIDFVGTYPLPEAQMDRFFMKIRMGYPEREEEADILRRYRLDDQLKSLSPVARAADIIELQRMVRRVYVDDSLYSYTVDIVRRTRSHPDVELGASPRGSLSLFRAAQAWALFQGRDYAFPDDVKEMATPVLSHRLVLRQEARVKRVAQEDIVSEILNEAPVPVKRIRAHA